MELILRTLKTSELLLKNFWRGAWPGSNYYLSGLQPSLAGYDNSALDEYVPRDQQELEDKKSEGFVWGVPKKRRSLEVRLCRKHGAREWHWKMLEPKTDLRICDTCGHHYRARHLCRNCYERVKSETEAIRSAAENQFGDTPEDKSVIVLYENEVRSAASDSSKSVVIEMKKERPSWFSRNLLQRSTTGPDSRTTTIAVTPKNLGET